MQKDKSFATDQQTVLQAGTPVQLKPLSAAFEETILIKAKRTNTGFITIGGTKEDALSTSDKCFSLAANESVSIESDFASRAFIDATVSGEGVEIIVA